MRIYEIIDEENTLSIGVLLYFEKEKSFIIELRDDLNEWTAPLLLTSYVKKGIFTIPRDISLLWVKERIIPSGRQNIGSILKNHKLKEYDEMKFLELSKGRCSQDSMYIKRLESVPSFVTKRNLKNLTECTALENNNLLCIFADGTVKKVSLSALLSNADVHNDVKKLINNHQLFLSCKIGTGGYYVTFADSIDLPAWLLYKSGKNIPLSYSDLLAFIKTNLLDTQEACQELACTRQNISYMVAHNQLNPVKESAMGNLYMKGDVVKNGW